MGPADCDDIDLLERRRVLNRSALYRDTRGPPATSSVSRSCSSAKRRTLRTWSLQACMRTTNDRVPRRRTIEPTASHRLPSTTEIDTQSMAGAVVGSPASRSRGSVHCQPVAVGSHWRHWEGPHFKVAHDGRTDDDRHSRVARGHRSV